MRDVELLNNLDPAYAAEGAGQFPDDSTQLDPSYAADNAQVMPGTGGEFGVGVRPQVSGPEDGGLELMDTGATYTPPAALVKPNPATVATGRSVNPATTKRLYPWKVVPGMGLTWSYQSQAALATMETATAPPVGGLKAETPRDDDDGGEEEEEGVEQKKDEDVPESPTRRRLFTRTKKGK